MPWLILHFLCGALLANSVPHLTHGLSGERFQSPFAKPPGVGLSSPVINVLWGFCNLFAGLALLIWHPPAALPGMALMALGALAMGLFAAWHFGKVRGNL